MTLTAAAANAHEIDVSWTPLASPPTRYELYRDGAFLGSSNSTRVRVSGLAPETRHCFFVYAVYFPFGVQSRSNEDCATTPVDAPPTTPAGLSATVVSPARIDLAWTASNDDIGVAFYRITRDGAALATASALAYEDASANPATEYCYQVGAVDTAGQESPPGNRVCAATPADTDAPTAPASLHATPVPGAIALAWAASADNGAVASYRLERDGSALQDVQPPAAGVQVEATDVAIAADTQYCYVVRAVDRAGNGSAPSNVACTTTSWQHTTLAGPATAFDVVGERNALALDAAGRLHVVYSALAWDPVPRAFGPVSLRYGTGLAGAWSESALATGATLLYRPAIGFAANAVPGAAFIDAANGFPWYVAAPGAQAERVAIEVAAGISLAAQTGGEPRVAYGRSDALRLAVRGASGWSLADVPGAGPSSEPVLVADALGRLNAVFVDPVARALRHARFDGASWSVTTIEPANPASWQFVALAVDAAGAAHVSYYDGAAQTLKVAGNRGGAWTTTTVDAAGQAGARTAIAVDRGGAVHVSYVDFANAWLKYATNVSGVWRTYALSDAGVGANGWGDTSIAVDAGGRVHIVYHAGSALRHATHP